MRCLETRRRVSGIIYRRYEHDDGEKHTTYEIPSSVARSLGIGKLQAAMATWHRGELQRQTARAVRRLVLAHPGTRAVELADLCGITEARVRQIRQENLKC